MRSKGVFCFKEFGQYNDGKANYLHLSLTAWAVGLRGVVRVTGFDPFLYERVKKPLCDEGALYEANLLGLC